MNKVKEIFKIVMTAITAITALVAAAEMENEAPGSGAAKKATVVAKIKEVLSPILPDWADAAIAVVAPALIDMLVGMANKLGFFAPSAAPSSGSSNKPS